MWCTSKVWVWWGKKTFMCDVQLKGCMQEARKWLFFLVQMSSIFACDLGLNRKTLSHNFFCCFVVRFREIFFNQHWRQMRASLILLFGKTKAFFGKDTARKKLHFCICYLWKMKEKPANLNMGVCFSTKWKATCRN